MTADKAPMKRAPLTKQRSKWKRADLLDFVIFDVPVAVWLREVGDGTLKALVSQDPDGWHLSISFADHRGRGSRYPRWDEIADARYRLLDDNLTMCMVLPPPDEYVALHDTTFHLHEHHDGR